MATQKAAYLRTPPFFTPLSLTHLLFYLWSFRTLSLASRDISQNPPSILIEDNLFVAPLPGFIRIQFLHSSLHTIHFARKSSISSNEDGLKATGRLPITKGNMSSRLAFVEARDRLRAKQEAKKKIKDRKSLNNAEPKKKKKKSSLFNFLKKKFLKAKRIMTPT